jgi:hypothetical protein
MQERKEVTMKKLTALLLSFLLAFTMCLSACGDSKVINGKRYETAGFFDQHEIKHPCVKYKFVVGSIIWSILLVETLIAPVLILGYDLWEPISGDQECFDNLEKKRRDAALKRAKEKGLELKPLQSEQSE